MIDRPTLSAEIETTLNRYSAEAGSNTPDFILAEYLMQCLKSFNAAVCAREAWYGRGEKAYNTAALSSDWIDHADQIGKAMIPLK